MNVKLALFVLLALTTSNAFADACGNSRIAVCLKKTADPAKAPVAAPAAAAPAIAPAVAPVEDPIDAGKIPVTSVSLENYQPESTESSRAPASNGSAGAINEGND